MTAFKNLLFRVFLRVAYPPHFSAKRAFREQRHHFHAILSAVSNTAIGRDTGLVQIRTYAEFSKQIPVTQYDFYEPYIARIQAGEQRVMTREKVRWLGKTAGTTSGKSKLIPLTRKFIRSTQVAGTFYSLSRLHALDASVDILTHKNFVMTGGIYETLPATGIVVGDISAIMMQNVPWPFRSIYVPGQALTIHPSWEYKINRIASEVSRADVGTISGVPTWHLAVLQKIKEDKPFTRLRELWPHFRIFFHGGVNFDPYRLLFQQLCGNAADCIFFEAYNATEGFFGIQSDRTGGDLLLLTNSAIFYEFIPFSEFGTQPPHVLSLEEVVPGVPYVLLITTLNGLLRYVIGDVLTFTATDPFTFRITGRTQEYINAFGEDLLLSNVVNALMKTNAQFGSQMNEYTVAPQYISLQRKGQIQFIVEFLHPPKNPEEFAHVLDRQLQLENTNYAQKRNNDLALISLELIVAPAGTFYRWMERKGKLGGQHKVPRLVNNRTVADEILQLINAS